MYCLSEIAHIFIGGVIALLEVQTSLFTAEPIRTPLMPLIHEEILKFTFPWRKLAKLSLLLH